MTKPFKTLLPIEIARKWYNKGGRHKELASSCFDESQLTEKVDVDYWNNRIMFSMPI